MIVPALIIGWSLCRLREEVKASIGAMEGVDQNVTLLSGCSMSSPTETDFRKTCQLNDGAEKISSLFKFLILRYL